MSKKTLHPDSIEDKRSSLLRERQELASFIDRLSSRLLEIDTKLSAFDSHDERDESSDISSYLSDNAVFDRRLDFWDTDAMPCGRDSQLRELAEQATAVREYEKLQKKSLKQKQQLSQKLDNLIKMEREEIEERSSAAAASITGSFGNKPLVPDRVCGQLRFLEDVNGDSLALQYRAGTNITSSLLVPVPSLEDERPVDINVMDTLYLTVERLERKMTETMTRFCKELQTLSERCEEIGTMLSAIVESLEQRELLRHKIGLHDTCHSHPVHFTTRSPQAYVSFSGYEEDSSASNMEGKRESKQTACLRSVFKRGDDNFEETTPFIKKKTTVAQNRTERCSPEDRVGALGPFGNTTGCAEERDEKSS